MTDSFWSNREELFVGAMLQWFLYFLIGWWVIPVMIVCAFLWRMGGWSRGNKLWRRIGVPLVVCGTAFAMGIKWPIFLAGPFMVWLAPSYGEKSWLYKQIGPRVGRDFLTRICCYFWYWSAVSLGILLAG